jgi:uncharacterized membrane protein
MPNHADLAGMVPPFVPFPGAVVYATGVLEILGALGLVIGGTRGVASLSLAALFVLLLPANIYAVVAGVPFHGGEASPLWLRIPEQILYIGVALWVARRAMAQVPTRGAAKSHLVSVSTADLVSYAAMAWEFHHFAAA